MNKLANHKSTQTTPARKWTGLFWGAAIVVANGLIWSLAIAYVKTTSPTYASKWSVILPGSGSGASVSIPEIGQASSSSSSAFSQASADPRANYLFISNSEPVLVSATELVEMSMGEFGKPRIKLIDNTTIMEFEVRGASPEQARDKALAHYQALNQQLSQLRLAEVQARDSGIESTLEIAKTRLSQAQQNLSTYKVASGLNSPDQLSNLSINIEQLRKQRAEISAQEQLTNQQLNQLAADLELSPQQAADAFVLRSDRQFQQNLQDYSEATASLDVLIAKWGENHPEVKKERSRQTASQAALLARSQSLIGKDLSQLTLEKLSLALNTPGAARESLLKDLISLQSQQQGVAAQVGELSLQIEQLEAQYNQLAQKENEFDSLNRDLQIAEAVFASTLAKLDLGKSDIFTSYPLIQLLSEPTLASEPSTPKSKYALLGAALGSIMVTTGIGLLAARKWILAMLLDQSPPLPPQRSWEEISEPGSVPKRSKIVSLEQQQRYNNEL